MDPIPVTLALGANVGNPAGQLAEAVGRLRPLMEIRRVSSVYRTEPVGIPDQPDFLNIALCGVTHRTVYELHAGTQAVERAMGRVRTERNGPRRIDVDLLSYGPLVLATPDLVLPHPRLHERAFVLAPLAEIDAGWRHPLLGESAADLLAGLATPSRVEAGGTLDF